MKVTRGATQKIMLLAGITILLVGCGHKHQWVEATCTEPKTCSECGETEGEPLGHDFADATCTEPKKCKRCGGVQGEPLGHDVKHWATTDEPTCANPGRKVGLCSVCNDLVVETISASGHEPSEDWEIVEEATFSTAGKRVKICTVCGEEVESESFEMTDEEKDDYRPSIEGDHFDCTVDDFIECFKYKNRGSYTITKITSDDESQSYILQARSKLKCIIVCTKTDEGKLKAILVQSDEDETSAIAVGLLMASTIDDYFDSNDRETTNEVATKLFLGKNVEHDGLVLGMITLNDGSKGLVIAPN